MEKWSPPKAAKNFGVKNPKIKESCGSGASPVGAARPKASPVGARPVGAPEADFQQQFCSAVFTSGIVRRRRKF